MPSFPPEIIVDIEVSHLTIGSTPQTYTRDKTMKEGGVTQMSSKDHALLGSVYVNPHNLYMQPDSDIRVGDKVVINSNNFFVQHVANFNYGGMAHLRCTISSDAPNQAR